MNKFGGAKGRKKLTKKKNEYQFFAPRYKEGKMVDGNLLMEEKRLLQEEIDEIKREQNKQNEAALKIQKNFRGKKSRNKYDMKSKWYKGFPTYPPEEVPDLELNSRLTDMAIQGFNSRNYRDILDDKQLEMSNKYMNDLKKLGKKNELKYNWGEYYNTYGYNKEITDNDRRLIGYEKKNYDKLKEIAKKKKYWRENAHKKLDQFAKYDPNKITDTERFNIREVAVDFTEYPNANEHYSKYYKGQYYDEDTDGLMELPDYNIEEMPELSPIKEEDIELYEEGDEFLIPYSQIEEAVEYYKDRMEKEKNLFNKYELEDKNLLKEYDELDKKQELDIEKCLHAKKLANTDIKLYKDKYFMKNYYEPCSDNERLTDIYIDTFYSLPWQLIKPAVTNIEEFLYNIPSIYLNKEDEVSGWKNAFITEPGVQIFRKILQDQGLLKSYYGAGAISDNPPFDHLHYLSNFYRWAVNGHTRIRHLRDAPIFRGNKYGKEYLRDTFRRLDEAFEALEDWHPHNMSFTLNGRIDKSQLNIEKFKRYFILNLIGLIGNPKYPNELKQYIDRNEIEISKIKNELKELIEQEQKAIEYRDRVISKFEYEGEKKHLATWTRRQFVNKFIKDYKLGLLAGLDEHDDSIMHTTISILESVEPEIKSLEKKIEKMEKDLDTAIRFSKITFTEKDFQTFEYEKLIYK